jgi:hypothetical protein
MNGYREENSFCYFHPNQVLVGVCPLCLNERLLILAAKPDRLSPARTSPRKSHNYAADDHDASTSQEGIA